MTERCLGRPPALLVVAHGSRDPRAAATVEALAARLRARRTGVEVAVAYLQHARPAIREALSTAYERGHGEVVVVPLLLTAAYHSKIDLPRQLADARSAGSGPPLDAAVRLAPVLGPDSALLAALERGIQQAGVWPCDSRWGLVVAAAGSTDPGPVAAVISVADQLRRRGWGAVATGFAASAEPGVPEAVAQLRAAGVSRVAIASYLLTPGRFSEVLRSSGADVVSAPLADTPEVAGLVLRRYDAEVRGSRVEDLIGPLLARTSTLPAGG